jgi:hypothetical protein
MKKIDEKTEIRRITKNRNKKNKKKREKKAKKNLSIQRF